MAEGIRIGGGGKKSGAYVWKKLSGSPVPQIGITMTAIAENSPVVLQITSDTVDLSKVDASFFVGIKGEMTTTSGTQPFEFISDTVISYGTGGQATFTYNPSTAQITWNRAYNVMATFKVIPDSTFLDFTVSDSPTAYPDGGEQGGYWYEKVVEGLPLPRGFTKYEVGSFTLTSDINYTLIKHSLGIMPKVAVIQQETPQVSALATRYVQTLSTVFASPYSAIAIAYGYEGSTYRDVVYAAGSQNTTEQQLHVVATEGCKFKAGSVYNYIILA